MNGGQPANQAQPAGGTNPVGAPGAMQNITSQILGGLFGGPAQGPSSSGPFGRFVMPQAAAANPLPTTPNLMAVLQQNMQQMQAQAQKPFISAPTRPIGGWPEEPVVAPKGQRGPVEDKVPAGNSFQARRSRGETSQR